MTLRDVYRRPQWATVLGSGLVFIGLALFMIVFVMLFPILTNPVGAYDRWFPSETPPPVVETITIERERTGPVAGFAWEAIVVESLDTPVYRVRFQETAIAGQADVISWRWDFGDGTQSAGPVVVHDYAQIGSFAVALTVTDAAGATDTRVGEVAVPGVAAASGSAGSIDEFLGLDIETSIEDAVGSMGDEITATLDNAFGSVGKSARGAVVVFLFALAAFATTIVAWRVARLGVMVLTRHTASPRGDMEPTAPAAQRDAERQFELV